MYIEVTDANTYFSERLFSETWDDSDDATKEKALKHATRSIEKLSFDGYKTDPEQELEFPRNGLTDIPEAVKFACCEEAIALLSGKNPEEAADTLNVSSEGFVSVRTTYDTKIARPWIQMGLMSKTAFELLVPYLDRNDTLRVSRA